MKNQLNSFYIFCTFRGQLILLVAFIIINLFNVGNYAYACSSNLFGESVGLAIKLQEDPNFIPEQGWLSPAQKARQLYDYYQEKAAFEGKPLPKNPIPLSTPQEQVLPKNPMPLSTPESPHSLPLVETPLNKEPLVSSKSVPQNVEAFIITPEKVQPLLVYNSEAEVSNLKEILTDIQSGEFPVKESHQRKFVHILTHLQKLEEKYKDAGMDQFDEMQIDMHKIFMDPSKAKVNMHYPDLHNFDAPSNNKFFIFQEEFQNVYFASKGNPLLLEAITVYNKNIAMYNRLLVGQPITHDIELTCYNDLYLKFKASYRRFTTILAEVEQDKKNI